MEETTEAERKEALYDQLEEWQMEKEKEKCSDYRELDGGEKRWTC